MKKQVKQVKTCKIHKYGDDMGDWKYGVETYINGELSGVANYETKEKALEGLYAMERLGYVFVECNECNIHQ